MSQPRTSTSSSWISRVLAAAALLGAVWMAYEMAHTAALVTRMRAWPTVPATLDAVELHRPGRATSRSKSVGARYHYTVGGRTYTATRVSVYAPDSLGSFFQRTFDDLHARLERGETVPAYVNPEAPAEAVLLPVWRPEVFAFQGAFMLVFGGAGLFVLARRRQANEIAAAPAGHAAPFGGVVEHHGAAEDPDADPVDMNERLPARAAWGRRLVLIGLLLLGADYFLLERSRGDQYVLIDRLLASSVTATGTIFVSPPDDRVPALFDETRRAQGAEARLDIEKREPQAVNYDVTLTAADRSAALSALAALQSAVSYSYRKQTGRDLTTFSSAYVAPVVTPSVRAMKTLILGALLLVGVACVAIGAWRAVTPALTGRA